MHVRTLFFLLLSLPPLPPPPGSHTLVSSLQNGGVLGLLPSFTVLSSLPPLGAVQIRYFRLTLTTPREGPNRPTRKRTLFRRKRKTSNKKRNETYKKRTHFKTKHPKILQIKCVTNAAAHKVVRRPHTFRSSSASLVRSHFPSKRKCQTRKRIGAQLCGARSVRPRPKWKVTRCELTAALCHTGPNVIARSTFTLRLACVKRRREHRRRTEGSHVQSLEKWTEDTIADLREHRWCCKGSPRQPLRGPAGMCSCRRSR